MESFSYYRGRMADILEEAMTRYEKRSVSPSVFLGEILSPETSKSKKVLAFLRLVRDVLPGLENSKENLKFFRDLSQIPVDPKNYEFKDSVGEGGECSVFLLESKRSERQSIVMKVYRRTDENSDELVRRGNKLRTEYLQIKEWYKDLPDLVPEETMIVAKDVRKTPFTPRSPALVIFQKFFGGELRDLFSGFNPGELESIMQEDPEFAAKLRLFAEISLQHEQETGELVDTFGDKNICITKQGGKHRLIILDPHVIHSSRSGDKAYLDKVRKHLSFLSELRGAEEVGKQI